jgi:hypothetical protein
LQRPQDLVGLDFVELFNHFSHFVEPGKTAIFELCILRLFQRGEGKQQVKAG